MKKLSLILASLGLLAFSNVHATDLVDVLHQAQATDPTYQGAKATYLQQEALVGVSLAPLLPNLSLTGTWNYNNTNQSNYGTPGVASGSTVSKGHLLQAELSLSQNLFNWAAFQTYKVSQINVKGAAATYAAAAQNLMLRVASAYFAVLQAQEVLRYNEAQQTALSRQLQVAQQRYKVGLDPITSVYEARASYDSARASFIGAEASLATMKENLRQITNKLYPQLAQLKDNFPLISPNPTNIDAWAKVAEQQNLSLVAQRYVTEAAKLNIKVAFAAHLPTLMAMANYSYSNNSIGTASGTTSDTGSFTGGAVLTLPLYSGGGVNSQVNANQYAYEVAQAQLEYTRRLSVADARTSYLNVVAEVSQIQADREAVKSAKASLLSNEAGYKVGTQTIVDVLNAQSTLYSAEVQYTQDRFSYVNDILALKNAAGTLNENDITQINSWLTNNA
jgi:outer membrane protein